MVLNRTLIPGIAATARSPRRNAIPKLGFNPNAKHDPAVTASCTDNIAYTRAGQKKVKRKAATLACVRAHCIEFGQVNSSSTHLRKHFVAYQ